jgi:hypothetical protein
VFVVELELQRLRDNGALLEEVVVYVLSSVLGFTFPLPVILRSQSAAFSTEPNWPLR